MTIERKTVEASIKQFSGEGRGTAVLARLGVRDKDGDVLVPGLLGGEQRAPLIQAHDWQVPPFGRAVVRERDGEMVADFALNLDTPRGKEWASVLSFDLAHGPIQEWSWGFSVLPDGSEMGTHEGERVRFLRRIQLYEVSPVIVAASVGSRTLSLKDASGDREELLAYLQGLPRERQEAWLTEAQVLCTEARVVLLGIAFDDLLAEPKGSYAFRYTFTTLPVEDPRRRAATAGLIAAAAELRSREPSFRFFREAMPGEPVDFISDHPLVGANKIPAYPDIVAVHEKLAPSQTLETVAHEVCHFARPGLPEAKVEEFGRELAREHDLRPTLVPVPVFVSAQEARELRKHQTIHYSPALNAEFVLGLRAVPTQRLRPKERAETDRIVAPTSGFPMPGLVPESGG